jgi:group I intron endonuclease
MLKQNISGIYVIINKLNGKRYIGSSKSIHYRWNQSHRPQLRDGNHCNRHLQSAWNKYGENQFEFQVLEECSKDFLLEREGHWIEHHRSWEREYGYNLVRIVDGKQVLSEESIQKRKESQAVKNYWQSGINAEILELYKNGKSKNAIAVELGVTRSAVYSCLEQNGLHENTGAGSKIKLTDDVKEQIKQLRDQDKTTEEIIEITGVSKTQLYRTKNFNDGKYGGKVNRSTYRTITPEVIEKAQNLRRTTKMTWKEIAKECGVSREWLSTSGACKGFEPRRNFKRKKESYV